MILLRFLMVASVVMVFGFDLVAEGRHQFELLQKIDEIIDRTEELKFTGMNERSELQVRLLEKLAGIPVETIVHLTSAELVRLEESLHRTGSAGGLIPSVGAPTQSVWLDSHSGAGF